MATIRIGNCNSIASSSIYIDTLIGGPVAPEVRTEHRGGEGERISNTNCSWPRWRNDGLWKWIDNHTGIDRRATAAIDGWRYAILKCYRA